VSDLREILDGALSAADHVEPPVHTAMRRGKSIRLRRRLTAAAGVVVVAAAALTGYRSLSGLHPLSAADPGYVTVTAPGPGSPPGLIASGTLGTQSWQIYMYKPTTSGLWAGQLCFYGRGSAFVYSGTGPRAPVPTPGRQCMSPPASGTDQNWTLLIGPTTFGHIGVVASDVAYVEVRLTNGEELKLIPADCYGMRLVAYNVLLGTGTASATAYESVGGKLVGVPTMPGVP
jgi:hypothetical protein